MQEIEVSLLTLNKNQEELKYDLKKLASIPPIRENEEDNDKIILFLQETSEITNRIISNYEQLLSSDFELIIKNMTKEEVDQNFEIRKTNQKQAVDIKKEIYKNYKVLESLKEDISKFLELEKTIFKITEIDNQLLSYQNVKGKLSEEKEKLEKFLEARINAFFYNKLINQIYQKIEPHPDYKTIEFTCDFLERSSPRLQIYTVDKNGNKSVPALYFSSAQINILSLSVFLAKALNAKDPHFNPVNCIFIDDPIQSMDSINILSFIDLFRSIVVNFKKQIIISTHEENFHNLLKKKIPSDLFKSKFIEFETFGKISKQSFL